MKNCLYCGIEIINPKFCSRSCSAKYNNHGRILSAESKKKTSLKLKGKKPANTWGPHTKVSKCINCLKWFAGVRKTCSDLCYITHQSAGQTKRLSKCDRRKYGRGKKSYLELSFEQWLIDNNITKFETEVALKNFELKKTYFVDFLFLDKNLIIELDGTQHEKTKENDRTRDQYISKKYGFKIIRISYKEYISKSRIKEIKSLLGI